MFAPKVARPQTKAAESSKNSLASRSSMLLARRTANPTWTKTGGDREQEAGPENATAREAPRGVSWDFSNIPLFPPDWADRPRPSSPLDAPPLFGAIQAKLVVGSVDDPLEREADRVADQVMRTPDPDLSVSPLPPQISRKCAAWEEEDKRKLQTKSTGTPDAAGREAPPIVHEALRSPGQPLDPATRAFFPPRFGYDFSHVAQMAGSGGHGLSHLQRQIGNRAMGRLLASQGIQAKLVVSPRADRLEDEADRVADRVVRMPAGSAPLTLGITSLSGAPVQRACPKCEEEKLQRKSEGGGVLEIVDGAI